MSTEMVHEAMQHRITGRVDGVAAAWVDYLEDGDIWDFTHTWTEPEFRGQGMAAHIVAAALAVATDHDKKVRASCPYVAEYLRRHPLADADE